MPAYYLLHKQALKAYLNTPQPSGKLPRWGMALQELELSIHYRPGKSNANADSLSRTPIESGTSPEDVKVVVATLNADVELPKDGDQPLGDRQRADPILSEIITYLERGDLPEDSKRSKELVSGQADCEVIDGILYRVDAKKTLKIVLPTGDRRKIFDEAHGGVFGGACMRRRFTGNWRSTTGGLECAPMSPPGVVPV